MFLITVDAHTEWLDAHVTSFMAAITIEKLKKDLLHLVLLKLVSYDGLSFTCHEYENL